MGLVQSWWTKTFSTLSNFASIASWVGIGFPLSLLSAGGAGLWAWLAHAESLYLFLISLFVFAAMLWSFIGVVWITNEMRRRSDSKNILPNDCFWGLIIVDAHFFYDKNASSRNLQLLFFLVNVLEFPVRFRVVKETLTLERKLAILEIPTSDIGVIPRTGRTLWRSKSFSVEDLPDIENLVGSLELEIEYGHARQDFSRKRTYECKVEIFYGKRHFIEFSPIPGSLSIINEVDSALRE